MILQQLSVFLENRAGQLAEITGILAENGIDLRAINIAEAADYGVLRIIADDTRRAAAIFSAEDYVVSVTPVAVVEVPDRPGGLNRLLELLERESINIEYMYSIFGNDNGKAGMVLRVADPEGLQAMLDKESDN